MAKKTYTFSIDKEISNDIDKVISEMVPQLTRSQFVEVACIEKFQRENRKAEKAK